MQACCSEAHPIVPSGSASAPFELRPIAPDHPERPVVEAFVAERFRIEYGAELYHFMPMLLALYDAGGRLVGAAGYRLAGDEALYLEQYLDSPIEITIQRECGLLLPRSAIVEVGNLGAITPGGARHLIREVTDYLYDLGQTWVSFTATRTLINAFRRLGLRPLYLAPADPARLGHEADHWGSYYEQGPKVVAGPIAVGYHTLHRDATS